MNKRENVFFTILILTMSVFLVSCNQTYYKVNDSPLLKKTEANYNEVYQFKIAADIKVNFIRNDSAVAVSSAVGVNFTGLINKKILKEINSPEWRIYSADSNKDGSRYALSIDGVVRVFNTQNWTLINQFGTGKSVDDVILSTDGGLMYLDGSLWNVDTGEEIKDHIGNRSPTDYAFSDDNRYYIQSEIHSRPSLIDINTGKLSTALPHVQGSNQVSFKDNKSYYIDYGAIGSAYAETLVLLTVEPAVQLAEITPWSRISCWTQLEEDTRLVMGLEDGDVLVLDEKLNVLYHWSLGSTVLKCEGGKNGKAWLATESSGLFELDINKKTLANPVKLEGRIKELVVSSDEKYIALVDDIPGREAVAKVYLR